MWHFSKRFVSGPVPSPSLARRAETDWAGQVVHDILLKTLSISKAAPRTSSLAKLFPRPSAARLSTHARPAPAKSNTAMWVSVSESGLY